jgi:glutamyl-tRNA synthetase
MEELIQEFTLERVGKAGAVFNIEKLNWLNQQHMRLISNEELAAQVKPMLKSKGITDFSDDYLLKTIKLLKERMTFVQDFIEYSDYFFHDPNTYEEAGVKKYWEIETNNHIKLLAERLEQLIEFTHSVIEQVVRQLSIELGIKAGKLIHPTRLALSGRQVGPGLFEMMELLGKETVVRRLYEAVKELTIS